MLRSILGTVAVIGILALLAAPIQAEQLFDQVSKDFGSVPRGTVLSHQFRLTNVTQSTMHIAGLRTSCVCSTASMSKYELQPGESATLHVTVDTKKYSGPRTFTIYVHIDRPIVEEVRLLLQATSRDDVTMEPGQLQFGRVKKGTTAAASMVIEYHGPIAWQINEVENDNAYLQPKLQRLASSTNHVMYQLDVKLREDIPVGAWHADIWLKTNDPTSPRIRVPIVMEVEGTLTATPTTLDLGQVKPGTTCEKRVVIRGTTPFRITKIEGQDDRLQVSGGGSEARAVHVLKVTFTAEKEPAEFSRQIRVLTDLPAGEQVSFTVQGYAAP